MGVEHEEAGVVSAYFQFIVRAYEIPPALAGRRVRGSRGALRGRARLRRARPPAAGSLLECEPGFALRAGDRVVLVRPARAAGRRRRIRCARTRPRTRSCSTSRPCRSTWCSPARTHAGRTLAGARPGARGARRLPAPADARRPGAARRRPTTVVERGDVLTLTGARSPRRRRSPAASATPSGRPTRPTW